VKAIIAGSRNFYKHELLKQKCDEVLCDSIINGESIEIVSGKARGTDELGERYAAERGFPVKSFPADWETYSNHAGTIRNAETAEYADTLIAFWDGYSSGTRNMIRLAEKKGLTVFVFRYS